MKQDRTNPEVRTVGLVGAVAIGIGGMVGGGIFAVLGVVAGQAGSGAPLAFLLAGMVTLLTASSYARLSVMYPSRGGSVVFVDRVFGVRLATGALNNLLWFGYLVTLSLYAVAFASYAGTFFSSGGSAPGWLHHLLITAAILVPTGLNLLSAAIVAKTETAIVAVKLAMLALVGAAGMTTVQGARLSVGTWPSLPAITTAGMLVFVAYEGFELIANSGDDIKDPRRNLPRALYLAVSLVIVLYVGVAVVTVGSLSADQIAQTADFALAEAAKPSLGQFGFTIVAISAVLATLSAINATLYGTARLSYSIALEGELPPAFERRVWTEPVGLLVTAGVSLLLANSLGVTEISSIASAVFLIVFGIVNAAAFRAAAGGVTRLLSAGSGVVGCLTALILLLADTATRRPLALGVLAVMIAASLVGEGLWLHRRRELQLVGKQKPGT
jgi:amino acid transporter